MIGSMRAFVAIATVLALAGLASADNKDKADQLFKEGKRLMALKRYGDACASFEQSFKLDPGIGAQLNTARCYEEWGKLAIAYRGYQHAEEMAKEAGDNRASQIHDLVAKLETQVPKVTIRIPDNADTTGLKVTLDSVPLELSAIGKPQLVDPGPRSVEYQLPGEKRKLAIVSAERGGSSEVTLELPLKKKIEKPDKPDKPDKPVKAKEPDPGKMWKIGGIATGGAGVVLVGISSVMTLSARSKFNDALAKDCGGMTNNCNPQGLKDTHDARSSANIATVVFLVGAAAIGGGVALYVMAPKVKPRSAERSDDEDHAFYLAPTVSPDGGGFVFGGNL
jgi:hypothetical protein